MKQVRIVWALFVFTAHLVGFARGAELRPIFAIAHKANSIEEAKACLAMGVNGLELDINVYASSLQELCVDHGPWFGVRGAPASAPGLAQFLGELRPFIPGTRLALLYFDCKPLAATPENGVRLLNIIRSAITAALDQDRPVRVIISVSKARYSGIFARIGSMLRENELAMIDQERQLSSAVAAVRQHGAEAMGFGYGSSVANSLLSRYWPCFRAPLREACRAKATRSWPVFVATFTVNGPRAMRMYLELGVDGIIADRRAPFYARGPGLAALVALIEKEGPSLGVRLATVDDVPTRVGAR